MKQRGSMRADALIGLGIFVAIALALWGVMRYLDLRDQRNFKAGQADIQARWTAANLKAEQEERARAVAVGKVLILADNAKLAAEDKAKAADQRWKEAVRESERKGKALAVCPAGDTEPAGPVAGQSGTGLKPAGVAGVVGPDRAAGPRFTDEFVRQYDSAWTGLGGEPVFGPVAGGEGAAGPGATWVIAEDIRDVHGENARRCSEDRRNYASLINKIRAAGAAWDNANPGASQ